VVDECGNSIQNQTLVYIGSDLTPPTGTAPAGQTGINSCYIDGSTPPLNAPPFDPIATAASYSDNCLEAVNVMLDNTSVTGDNCSWTLTYTYHVSDECGNSLTNQMIMHTGGDTEAPTFDVPEDVTIYTGEACSYDEDPQVTGTPSNVMDNCDNTLTPDYFETTDQGNCIGSSIITRTWYVEDDCGNSTTHVQIITVLDQTPPTFTAPADMTINKDANCQYDASVGITGDVTDEHDECDPILDAVPSDVTAQGSCEGEVIITRTWTLMDDCGNTTTHDQIITAIDITPPVVNAPDPVELECSDDLPAAVDNIDDFLALAGASAADACSSTGNLTVTSITGELVGDNCNGTIERTYFVTDDCGNSTAVAQIFNVSDNTPPDVTPGEISACYPTVADAEAAAIAATIATDNCSATEDLTFDVNTVEGMDCDSIVTVTVTDLCGNTNTAEYQTMINCQVVRLKVFLEGPYNTGTGLLNSALNSQHLLPGQTPLSFPFYHAEPAGQPYQGAPWNYTGNLGTQYGDSGGQTPYPTDVVDWILVMVRENGILPVNTIWTCAGWVHTDGTVTFPEDCPGPAIDPMNDYYIVVQHRNHLGIMSPDFVDIECGGAYLNWDFTTSNSYQPLFRFGQKEIVPGVWTMFAGNGEQISSIQAINSSDRTLWKIWQGWHGYSPGDFNMSGLTGSEDETMWKNNQNKTTGVVFY
jgi:hypothetical protein